MEDITTTERGRSRTATVLVGSSATTAPATTRGDIGGMGQSPTLQRGDTARGVSLAGGRGYGGLAGDSPAARSRGLPHLQKTHSLSSGTRGYRAPEILFAVNEMESSSVYDETCDLFSLGQDATTAATAATATFI